jgi:hypothetical protein
MNWTLNTHMDMLTLALAGIAAAQQLWSREIGPVTASANAVVLNPQFRSGASVQERSLNHLEV